MEEGILGRATGRRRPISQRFEPATPVDQLVPHPENPRRGELGTLSRSLAAHGFYGAILAQAGTGMIIAGTHRWRAAVKRGRKTVPVLWLDVSDDRARRIMLVDNRSSDLASYDDGALSDLLASLAGSDLGLLGTGFDGVDDVVAVGRTDVDEFLGGEDRSSDDYFTPEWVFDLLGLTFDLDVASPPLPLPWLPAKRRYTKDDDGLASPWVGRVWMNPPYSAPGPWVERFLEHGHGVALLPVSNARWMRNLWASGDVAWAVHTDRSIDFVGGASRQQCSSQRWAMTASPRSAVSVRYDVWRSDRGTDPTSATGAPRRTR